MAVTLFDYQIEALEKIKNGCILNGSVGSGKSRTALAYYYQLFGGKVYLTNEKGPYINMKDPMNLYIITTARKRDTLEWEHELLPFQLERYPSLKVTIDSWNNIKKYTDVKYSFFIFDEQRVVGYGAWTKTFLTITKVNRWILLSATPGDTWQDYIPVFIADGFYKNKADFERQHVIYSRWSKYPKVDKYINEGRLQKQRKMILVDMDYRNHTTRHDIDITVGYDEKNYQIIKKYRWNVFKDKPIKNISEFCQCLRRATNSGVTRQEAVLKIIKEHPRVIIFYSFDYELDILRNLFKDIYPYSEWNGHKHEAIPNGDNWAYLVEYASGCEGWNCILTDTIIFYSQNYSYKTMEQSKGRIDRLNTPYNDLYYYHLRSNSNIDMAIAKSIARKKKFNEKKYAEKIFVNEENSNEQTNR